MLSANELRKKYLDFFAGKNHALVDSSSLLPENDPTTLFTGSGMQPMVPYLLGQQHPRGKRVADSQKCFRSVDIDEVGDNRHTTFFEMLGNWSFGDYFKKEQILWIYEFLTKEAALDPKRLYITVFRGNEAFGLPRDEEAVDIWKGVLLTAGVDPVVQDFAERDGIQPNARLFYYDEKKNWWSRAGAPSKMPDGEPGGPDSEIFWDFGAELNIHENSIFADQPCHVNCDCGRFFEICNSVFMEYIKTDKGFQTLPSKNVDFGGGLERMMTALANTPDVFLIDIFDAARKHLELKSGKHYTDSAETTQAFRVILDHLRAATFLIADGAFPSNKDQGYFVRRLIRRAIRFAHVLDIKENFCETITRTFIEYYKEQYPVLAEKREVLAAELQKEENKFRRTLANGLKIFEKWAKKMNTGEKLSAIQAFDLYQTYGFPLELTLELAQERALLVDETGFALEMNKHRNLSREGAQQKFAGGLADHSDATIRGHTATHLLHQALRTLLGAHVFQKGSNITPERIRFDFTHHSKMTHEEVQQVEALVNTQIQRALSVTFEIIPLEDAKKLGAIGLFDEKYGDMVKVYTVGDFSKEFCGGPHVENTNQLGSFKILKEEAVSAGVRRIKAVIQPSPKN